MSLQYQETADSALVAESEASLPRLSRTATKRSGIVRGPRAGLRVARQDIPRQAARSGICAAVSAGSDRMSRTEKTIGSERMTSSAREVPDASFDGRASGSEAP